MYVGLSYYGPALGNDRYLSFLLSAAVEIPSYLTCWVVMDRWGRRWPLAISMIAGPAYKEFVTASGPLADNIASSSWWQPSVRYKGKDVFGSTEAFNAAFAAKYKGDEADYIEASSAACGVVIQLAMETENTADPKRVRDAIATLDVETFYGKIKFGPIGQITSLQPPVFQIQGGKPVVIWPTGIKQGDFRYMKR